MCEKAIRARVFRQVLITLSMLSISQTLASLAGPGAGQLVHITSCLLLGAYSADMNCGVSRFEAIKLSVLMLLLWQLGTLFLLQFSAPTYVLLHFLICVLGIVAASGILWFDLSLVAAAYLQASDDDIDDDDEGSYIPASSH